MSLVLAEIQAEISRIRAEISVVPMNNARHHASLVTRLHILEAAERSALRRLADDMLPANNRR